MKEQTEEEKGTTKVSRIITYILIWRKNFDFER